MTQLRILYSDEYLERNQVPVTLEQAAMGIASTTCISSTIKYPPSQRGIAWLLPRPRVNSEGTRHETEVVDAKAHEARLLLQPLDRSHAFVDDVLKVRSDCSTHILRVPLFELHLHASWTAQNTHVYICDVRTGKNTPPRSPSSSSWQLEKLRA